MPNVRGACGCTSGLTCKFIPGPPAVKNIILNELCERFSFYSARAILVLYLTDGLNYGEDTAISFYSYFMAATYFAPLFGGYIADVYLGKYKTIVSFNIIYLVGITVLAGTAFIANAPGAFVGLFLIAAGTGGIKPCIAPFGAEQLGQCSEQEKTSFFFIFYASINAGSTFSYILTPIVREHAGFGPAFSLACVMISISFVVFVLGRKQYVRHPPAGVSAYGRVFNVLRAAFAARNTTRTESTPLMAQDTASGTSVMPNSDEAAKLTDGDAVPERGSRSKLSDKQLGCLRGAVGLVPVEDLTGAASVLGILPVFAMLPVFWAIYDSQGSIWTLQRKHADNCIGSVCLTPEQLGALNPILILVLVPLFDKAILPCLRRSKWTFLNPTPLRRMSVGMQLAALAFLLTWFMQVSIDDSPPNSVNALWQLPQFFIISMAEVCVSATGLEWAYSQSKPEMRGTIVSLYHAMVAIGNLLTGVLFDALAGSLTQAQIILVLAGMMVVAGGVFSVLAWRYSPLPHVHDDETVDGTAAAGPTLTSSHASSQEEGHSLLAVSIADTTDTTTVSADTSRGRERRKSGTQSRAESSGIELESALAAQGAHAAGT